MQAKSINPYSSSDEKIKEALDFIIANLPMSPTFNQFNEVLLTSIFGAGPDSPMEDDILPPFLMSVMPLTYNGYVNGGERTGDGGRGTGDNTSNPSSVFGHPSSVFGHPSTQIISKLLKGVKSAPLEALGDIFVTAEETVAASGLSYQEQLPLYFAIQSGRSHHQYWTTQMNTPGGWALYLNTDYAINYIHAPSWISAGIEGALLSYGIIKPAQAQFPDLFSGMIGAVGLAAGKVVFGWNGREF